jgi:F0F1-type ATP synthase gamma subunit
MEAVSAAKMRKAQQKALAGRAYARAAVSILGARLGRSRACKTHPLDCRAPVVRSIYSHHLDKGLGGALNSAVLRAVWADIKILNTKECTYYCSRPQSKRLFYCARIYVELSPKHRRDFSQLIRELVDDCCSKDFEGRSRCGKDRVSKLYFDL